MTLKPKDLLDLTIYEPDSGAVSIRDYFRRLLTELWNEEAGFSGKRPFGNSGWQIDLQVALIKAGAPFGAVDEDGCFAEDGVEDFDAFILRCIKKL